MRLLILSLLALGAQAHSISYRNNLLGYSPARGEFPVQGELAQGYLRYLDNTGAERLVGFNYPEPLYGIRSEQLNPQLYSNKLDTQQQHLALFRAWCEQRYNALRIELERLSAEGKQPSANILAQLEPLEQIIKTNAFEPVPGLSPELQRIRDEHLRIWNEGRLQVLQAELAQGGLPQSADQQISQEAILLKTTQAQPQAQLQAQPQAQPATAKLPQDKLQFKQTPNNIVPQFYVPFESPKPVQETDEVLRAREEHLKRFNEALQAQIKAPAEAPILKTNVQPQQTAQQTPQPVEETPEVKRAREEHLKQYNEEIMRQSIEAQQQPLAPLPTAAVNMTKSEPLPLAIKETQPIALLPAVTIKSSVPLPTKQNIHEQKIQLLNQSKIKAEDKVADIEDRIRLEERERDAERFREQELRREEEKQAELEREREQLRQIEEKQLQEAERISLQMQEQQRIANERLQESKRLQAEQQIIFSFENTPAQPSNSYKLIAPTPVKPQTQQQVTQPQAQPQTIAQQQQVQNGFFLRIQSGQPSAEPIPESVAQNPFLIRYIQQPHVKAAPSFAFSSPASASSTASSLSSSNSVSTGFSELEKATREHFKAHEIALEQLRLANLKNPNVNEAPCQHDH